MFNIAQQVELPNDIKNLILWIESGEMLGDQYIAGFNDIW
jgi:hypothetical protein